MALAYLFSLAVSLGCMVLLDRRFRLVLWRAPRTGAVVLGVGIALFLAWDLAAIAAGHYAAGQSRAMTGIMLAPELPLEEILFITFLCYLTLVLRGLLERLPAAARDRRRGVSRGPGPSSRPRVSHREHGDRRTAGVGP
ncbi:lycopene cyclase domain-containing protein [Citricoccus sp. SGAir0253]|uniref:lycopene cyclase domain-containing protein n=1 Tax=Citricoccus sp. SGAir0253 TaxID=2567881 RepID=UPI0010CD39FB|nr:lycopene cyclase domain-containing protein [Citricoccus sp. SGAir0253]QCU77285.1 lycopene cyclase domain-containing protein [Citricoccus sp. SGAir0253]